MNVYLDNLFPRLTRRGVALALPAARVLILLAFMGWTGWRLHPLLISKTAEPVRVGPPDLSAAAAEVVERHWFGVEQPPVPPSLTVQGVFAPEHGAQQPGFAIARHDGGSGAIWTGQQIGDWQVVAITPKGVTLALGRHRQFYPLSHAAAADAGHEETSSDDASPPMGDEE